MRLISRLFLIAVLLAVTMVALPTISSTRVAQHATDVVATTTARVDTRVPARLERTWMRVREQVPYRLERVIKRLTQP